MTDYPPLALRIVTQGAPRVNAGEIVGRGPDVIALSIDLHSKRCAVEAISAEDDGSPTLYLNGEGALHLHPEHAATEPTLLNLPDYPGWRVFAADISRYTLNVCLVKPATS